MTVSFDERPQEFHQSEFWQDVVCRTILEGECEAGDATEFTGDLSSRSLEDLALVRLSSVAQVFRRTAEHIRRSRHEESISVILQVKGDGTFVQDGREARLSPGDFMFTDSTRPAALKFDRPFEQLVLRLPRRLLQVHVRSSAVTAITCKTNDPLNAFVSRFLLELPEVAGNAGEAAHPGLKRAAEGLLVAVIESMVGQTASDQPPARAALLCRAKAYIEGHAADDQLDPASVARALGVSVRYLQSVFSDAGITPASWIWEARLRLAHAALSRPGDRISIGEIATMCGFQDFGHFSRRFKQAYGVTPREYRGRTKR